MEIFPLAPQLFTSLVPKALAYQMSVREPDYVFATYVIICIPLINDALTYLDLSLSRSNTTWIIVLLTLPRVGASTDRVIMRALLGLSAGQ